MKRNVGARIQGCKNKGGHLLHQTGKARSDHHGVGVRDEILEGVQEALVLHQLGIDVMELGHADGRCLAHIRVLILQALAQGLTQVLCYLVHTDAAHGPHGQGTDQRVWVLTVLQGQRGQ